MKDDNSRLSSPGGKKQGEAIHISGRSDSESWRPVRLNSDEPTENLQSQITWFLFVSLQLFLFLL